MITTIFAPLFFKQIFFPLFSIAWIVTRHLLKRSRQPEARKDFFLATLLSSGYFYAGLQGFNAMMSVFGKTGPGTSLAIYTVPILVDIASGYISGKVNMLKVAYQLSQLSGNKTDIERLKNYSKNVGTNKKLQILNRAVIYWMGMGLVTLILSSIIGSIIQSSPYLKV